MPDAGCRILDAGAGAGCWMLDAGYWILDAGYWMLDTGCWMLVTGYLLRDIGYWVSSLFKTENLVLWARSEMIGSAIGPI
jgi:hypothetical protein